MLDCASIDNTMNSTEGGGCKCRRNFVWNKVGLSCDLNCSLDSKYQQGNAGGCGCKSPYYWDNVTEFMCILNCTGVWQSTGKFNTTSFDSC